MAELGASITWQTTGIKHWLHLQPVDISMNDKKLVDVRRKEVLAAKIASNASDVCYGYVL